MGGSLPLACKVWVFGGDFYRADANERLHRSSASFSSAQFLANAQKMSVAP